MKQMKLTEQAKLSIDNICDACERKSDGGCLEPCDIWYRCLEDAPVEDKEILIG